MQIPIQNELVLKELSSGDREQKVRRGLPIKKVFSLKNQGKQSAKIQVRIKGRDEQTQRLHLWCAIAPETLELAGNETKNFTLNFEIPVGEKVELYNYEILLIESSQYPPRMTRHFQQLRLPKSEWVEFPEFLVQPATSAEMPYALQAEELFKISVRVENRSELVDRFFLNCPDLPKDWYQINYPGNNFDSLLEGGLNLNPNRNGIIELLLTPPQYAPAGIYSPTLCLTSKSYREVVLLDIFYFRIIPDDRLEIELSPSLYKFPTRKPKKKRDRKQLNSEKQVYESEFFDIFPPEKEARSSYVEQDRLIWNRTETTLQNDSSQKAESEFDIRVKVINKGNIKRQIIVKAADSESLFKYDPPSQLVTLDPGEIKTTGFQLKSPQWWRRSLKGKGKEVQFLPEFENYRDRILPDTQKPPILPDIEELKRDRGIRDKKLKIETFLLLKPYPWWVLWTLILLIITIVLGTLMGLSIAAWLMFFDMPLLPQIKSLETVNEQQKETNIYKLENNESVFLKFAIAVPDELHKIVVTQIDEQQQKIRKTYSASELSGSAFIQSEANQKSSLRIRDRFSRLVSSLNPRSQPKSSPDLDIYLIDIEQNKLSIVEQNRQEIYLSLAQILGVKAERLNLSLLGELSTDIRVSSEEEIEVLLPGKYQFEIEIFPKEYQTFLGVRKRSNQKQIDSRITDTIDVIPKPKPSLSDLKSSNSTYQQKERLPLVLEWNVNNKEQLGKITILRQAEEGNIEVYNYLVDEIEIDSDRKIETERISDRKTEQEKLRCAEKPDRQLTCSWQQDISSLSAGLFTFAVEVFPQDDLEKASDRKEIKNTVVVIPKPLPKIEEFAIVEGQYEENKDDILVNFEIENPQQIQAVQIRLNSQDGKSKELKIYQYPQDLQESCSLPKPEETDKNLLCQKVSLGKLPSGEYSFQLSVIPNLEDSQEEITKITDSITVTAKPIKITSFKINGKEVGNKTSYLHANHTTTPGFLNFSWQIEGGEDTTVEFFPVGGKYKRSDSFSYAVPPGTSREIFILQATDPLGNIVTHVVTVQAYESNRPAIPNDSSDSISPQELQKKPALPRPSERPPQLN
jgi:hypothetical protein